MARCRQCNMKVRRAVEYCPHCGVHDPAQRNPLMPTRISAPIGIFILGGILFVALWSSGGGGGGDVQPVSLCKSDWTKCADNAEIANHYSQWFDAQFACKQAAIKQARYGTPVFPSLYFFSQFYPGTGYVTTGTATLVEPDAQFQNGFGAMVHSRVTCTYDLRAERVVSVNISAE